MPSTQRVVATGVSVVSFAAMTVAMGPLVTPSETTDAGDDVSLTDGASVPTTAQVPAPQPGVAVEVIPNYVPVTESGAPLPADMLKSDGTPAIAASVAPTPTTAVPAPVSPTTTAARTATGTAATAAPTTTAAPPSPSPPPPPPPRSEASG